MPYDHILIAKLRRINLFLALFYVPAWLSSSIGSNAAVNDFLFLENMSQYEKFDSAVAQAASKKLAKHKWYLEEETVVYVLFSDLPAITNGRKREMAQRLLNVPKPASFRTRLPVSNRPLTPSTKLSDSLVSESWFIFHALDLGYEWLIKSPELWNSFESFQETKRLM